MKKQRPYVICHMMSSVNGKILTAHWKGTDIQKNTAKLYEEIHNRFDSQGWICGRVTMERDFADGLYTHQGEQAGVLDDFIADPTATSFAFAVDAEGKLAWKHHEISGDHIVVILTGQASNDYLSYLRKLGISYLFAGEKELDLKLALEKIGAHFPVKTLMLEGGGHLNGQMMQGGLVDELSLLLLPIADATESTSVFEAGHVYELALKKVEQMSHGVLWLNYEKTK